MVYVKNKPTTHPTIKNGDVFEKWTVVDNTIVRHQNGGTYQIMVRCECGLEKLIIARTLTRKKPSRGCRTCVASGEAHYKWQGVGKLSASVMYAIERNAKLKGRRVDLTLEYLWELFESQDGKCALSGVELGPWISNNKKQGRRMSASLDRINSEGDYVFGNVQWVHKDINRLKTNFSQSRFIELCKLVAIYND